MKLALKQACREASRPLSKSASTQISRKRPASGLGRRLGRLPGGLPDSFRGTGIGGTVVVQASIQAGCLGGFPPSILEVSLEIEQAVVSQVMQAGQASSVVQITSGLECASRSSWRR